MHLKLFNKDSVEPVSLPFIRIEQSSGSDSQNSTLSDPEHHDLVKRFRRFKQLFKWYKQAAIVDIFGIFLIPIGLFSYLSARIAGSDLNNTINVITAISGSLLICGIAGLFLTIAELRTLMKLKETVSLLSETDRVESIAPLLEALNLRE